MSIQIFEDYIKSHFVFTLRTADSCEAVTYLVVISPLYSITLFIQKVKTSCLCHETCNEFQHFVSDIANFEQGKEYFS